jgi:F-type H+-transporting ATPase subunit delta
MVNPRIAARYAKSLLDLAIEQNSLEATLQDMQQISHICDISREFCTLLRSPVVHADRKQAVVSAVFNDRMNTLTKAFVTLLVSKGREGALPEIAVAFVDQYRKMKNISTVKLTTAAPVEDRVKEAIRAKVAASMPGQQIEMEVAVDAALIGGFTLEMDDKLVDASVRRDLNDIKKTFLDKSYTMQLK